MLCFYTWTSTDQQIQVVIATVNRKYLGLWIVQLKVCHRKCLWEAVGSEYVSTFSAAILHELPFKQPGTCLCNVLCQGCSAIAGLPFAHLLCLVGFFPGGCFSTFCLPDKLFCWLQPVLNCCLYRWSTISVLSFCIYMTQVDLLESCGQPQEVGFTFIYIWSRSLNFQEVCRRYCAWTRVIGVSQEERGHNIMALCCH